jgi:hypothetical protein
MSAASTQSSTASGTDLEVSADPLWDARSSSK